MNEIVQFFRTLICAVLCVQIATAQSSVRKGPEEPTSFSEDGSEFSRSVTIPERILNVVRRSEEAKSVENSTKELNRNEFAQLFKAVVIHLRDLQETDYVLVSESPMGGADAPWFWIVRSDPVRPKLIFFAFANTLELLKTNNRGYPDIRSHAFAGGTEYIEDYRYDGQKYVLMHKHQREISQ